MDRDRALVLQLKTDLQHKEDAIKKQGGAREMPVNGASGGTKLLSRQQERDCEEEGRHPELGQSIGAPQSKKPERKELLEKDRHRREEQDKQRRTPPRTMRQREGSRSSSLAKRQPRPAR